ncbi:uncharacterized protein LOC135483497 [Lineus longissimus]|uniref:uncharacterized protein LOC135483497 n=1 Tax=Lineus longissimus TaxID=88925 RepID=UPI002B4F6823
MILPFLKRCKMIMLQRHILPAVRLQWLSHHPTKLRRIALQSAGSSTRFSLIKSQLPVHSPRYFTSRSSALCNKPTSESQNIPTGDHENDAVDFFGIEEYEQNMVTIASAEKDNFGALKKGTKPAKISISVKAKKAKADSFQPLNRDHDILETSFGLIRLDGRRAERKLKGDLKSDQTIPNPESTSGSDFIDEQYFQYEGSLQQSGHCSQSYIHLEEEAKELSSTVDLDTNSPPSKSCDDFEVPSNLFDEQYFGSVPTQSATELSSKYSEKAVEQEQKSELNVKQSLNEQASLDDLNIFDQQMFGLKERTETENNHATSSVSEEESTETKSKPAIYSVTEDMKKQFGQNNDVRKTERKTKLRPEEMEYEFHEPVTEWKKKVKSIPVPNVKEPKTAYDMAMKIRQEMKDDGKGERFLGDVDSKGFRILKSQVPDFSRTREVVMVDLLRDSVIYNDHDIVAIDKPYGLPSQGGEGVNHNIASLLPKFAKKIDASLETLHSVHRLDKDTTGVMVFAKTREMQLKLTRMFKDHEVVKKYWVITKGIPDPPSGVIEIPMAEGTVSGAYRMVLKPDYDEKTKLVMKKSSVDTSQAITKYKVLDSNDNVGAALVLCEPKTGVKHQIRCHLSFGLNMPILGDHKYSHFTKLAPQRLFPAMLQRLGIRQSKVRHVPMHLHAKSIILPGILEGRYLHLSTKLPRHFVKNMKSLKLKPPQ